MKYSINLVRPTKQREKQTFLRIGILSPYPVFCFILLGLTILYTAYHVWDMSSSLRTEQKVLSELANHGGFRPTPEQLVSLSTLELIESLLSERTTMSEILTVMTGMLPANFHITKFIYTGHELRAGGSGYTVSNQNSLMRLHEFVKELQNDSVYNKTFHSSSVEAFVMADNNPRAFSFEFNARGR
ncbi:hypothetical protein ACFL5V_12455 [Fibrobacterota bacterium]